MRILIVGPRGGTHIADSLVHGGTAAALDIRQLDSVEAYTGPRWWRIINWRLRGHRPTHLAEFSARVLDECRRVEPNVVITTGLAPIRAAELAAIGRRGIRRVNFLTDDPWSPQQRAAWFFDAAPQYDAIFTPRRANRAQLEQLTNRAVHYLPFAYDPRHFHPDDVVSPADEAAYGSDVLFVGGADSDRVPYMAALVRGGFRLALYGGYWDRFAVTRPAARGLAEPRSLRLATRTTKIAICLVRRANRDGHVMRSFEIPAVGACMLAEDTAEHRELFGADGESVRYFVSARDMVAKARELMRDPAERDRLAHAAHARIAGAANTYGDRLATMLELPGARERKISAS